MGSFDHFSLHETNEFWLRQKRLSKYYKPYNVNRVIKYVDDFLANQDGKPTLDSLINEAVAGNTTPLENLLVGFFSTARVNNKKTNVEEFPKRSTFDAWLSHISTTILGRTKGRVDIKSAAVFPGFNDFLDGYKKTLKAEGKGDVDHVEGKCRNVDDDKSTECVNSSVPRFCQ